MRFLQSIFIILFFFLSVFFSFWVSETFAGKNFITKVNINSWEQKVKKLQEVFKWLGLYNWEIDWNFSSIKESLIDYQVKNWIIPDREHSEAWYFWKKTIKSLKQKFWKDFEDLQKQHLIMESPESGNEWYFIVTAYYTPLPDQIKYSTWSYSSEIKLNGWWNTASWKKPSAWTIAAPENYAFWTKIELDWIWVWVVEDRWWAIVNSWDRWHLHDRLDVWMWYWDEARERTRAWWVRTIKWKILDNSANVSVFFEKDIKNEENKVSSITKYKSLYVSPEKPNTEDVKALQKLLSEANLYFGSIDWNYDSIKEILIDFQLKNSIINSRNSPEAWYFWKKTYEVFKNKFWENFELVTNYTNRRESNLEIKKETLSSSDKTRLNKVRDNFYNKAKLRFNNDDKRVEEYISKTKLFLKDYSKKLSWNNLLIINYFIEIL